ncbi:hypothetical protein P9112_000666 [Eukaryota sp. TZLM1-RC]
MFASTVDRASVEVKDLSNFLITVPKLQKKLINALEAESLEQQISLANNSGDSSFATFLSSLCDKGSFINSTSCLITQVPRRFGLLHSKSQFLTIMRLRLNLPPPQCLTNIRCKCGAVASYTHVLSCRKFTQKRSIIHNAVRYCIYDLLKSAHHPVPLEPVFDEMQLAQSQKRGDIQCAWRSGQELIIDCTTVSPWKLSSSSDIESTLKNAERSKHSKYNDLLVRLNKQRGRNIVFVPIGISIFGTLGREGLSFLNDLGSFLKDSGRSFDQLIWKNRIVFLLFKALPRYFNSILLSITEFHNVRAHEPVNSEKLPSFCQ